MRNAGSRRKVVILDRCYSGRAHSNGYLAPGGHYTDFSGALISALENGLPGNGPYLDVQSVFAFLRQEMRSRRLPLPHLSTRDDGSAYTGGTAGTAPAEPDVSPPVREEHRRRRRPSRARVALLVVAVTVVAAIPVVVFVRGTGRSSAGRARAVELDHGDRPGTKTRFPGSHFSLLRDLTGPATLVAFEPPMAKGATHPVTYLWQPDRRCFAVPTGFGSTYLDVAVSADGKWIAGVDRRRLAGAGDYGDLDPLDVRFFDTTGTTLLGRMPRQGRAPRLRRCPLLASGSPHGGHSIGRSSTTRISFPVRSFTARS